MTYEEMDQCGIPIKWLTDNHYLLIKTASDGNEIVSPYSPIVPKERIPTLPHGRLIDVDYLIDFIRECNKSAIEDTYCDMTWGEVGDIEIFELNKPPVILPASEDRGVV